MKASPAPAFRAAPPQGLRYLLAVPIITFFGVLAGPPVIDFGFLFVIGAALAVVATVAILAEGPWRFDLVGGIIVFTGLLGLGVAVAVWANRSLDSAPAAGYSTHVTDKIARRHSRRRSRGPYLELAPWGPVTSSYRLSVNRATYAATQVGDRVCLALHPGALGARWYETVPCPG